MPHKPTLPTLRIDGLKKLPFKKMGHSLKRFFGNTIVMAIVSGLVGFSLVYLKVNTFEWWNPVALTSQKSTVAVGEAPTPVVDPPKDLYTITLSAQNGAKQAGKGTIQIQNARARVVVDIQPGPTGVAQPAFISSGSCDRVETMRFPLENVVNGKSETGLNVSVEEMQAMGPLVLEVRKSVEDFNVRISCGVLK